MTMIFTSHRCKFLAPAQRQPRRRSSTPKFLAFLLLSILFSPAWAQQSTSGHIAQLNVDKNGAFVRVQLDTPTINPGNCAGADFYILEVAGTQSNRMIAALYLAFAQRTPVTFWISGCTANAYWGQVRPSLWDVYMTSP